MAKLREHNAFSLVPDPRLERTRGGQRPNVMTGRWVHAWGMNAFEADTTGKKGTAVDAGDGRLAKAKWVARGFTMRYGVDYTTTSSPVLKRYTYKVLEILHIVLNWTVRLQIDVSSAYLNASAEITQYLQQPTGEIPRGRERHVMLLKRAIPGTKDAGYWWYVSFSRALRKAGMAQTVYDQCLWFKTDPNSNRYLFIGIIVDDGCVFGNSMAMWEEVRRLLPAPFKLKEAPLTEFNGIRAVHDPKTKTTKLSAPQYFEKAAKLARVVKPKTRPTYPFPTGEAWTLTPDDHVKKGDPRRKKLDQFPFLEALNTAAYPVQLCYPGMLYPVALLQQFSTTHGEKCHALLQRFLGYCLWAMDEPLILRKGDADGAEPLDVWADCSFNADYESNCQGGNVFFLFGSFIHGISRRLRERCTSSTHAEAVTVDATATFAEGMRGQLLELQEITGAELVRGPTPIRQDNTSTIAQMTAEVVTDKSRHYRRRVHHVRQMIADGKLRLVYTPSADHVADLMTKVPTTYNVLAKRLRTATACTNPTVPPEDGPRKEVVPQTLPSKHLRPDAASRARRTLQGTGRLTPAFATTCVRRT